MKIPYARAALVALMLVVSPAAPALETIDWDALVPTPEINRSPYFDLPSHVRRDFLNLWNVYELRLRGKRSERLDRLGNKSIAALEAAGVDAHTALGDMIAFVSAQKANESRLVEELNGKHVRLAGYLLPTEFAGSRIVEFLLVPSDGACVHTPVPPLNQLVYVRLDEGIEDTGLFTPVQVSGRLSTGKTALTVRYSDGENDVEAGYSMAATTVEPYDG